MRQAKSRKAIVVERHLGREGAVGQAWKDDGLIEIDPRQAPKAWFMTLVHETLHIAFPGMDEPDILRAERTVGEALWRAGVRRVHVK